METFQDSALPRGVQTQRFEVTPCSCLPSIALHAPGHFGLSDLRPSRLLSSTFKPQFLCHLFLGAIPLWLGIRHPDSELARTSLCGDFFASASLAHSDLEKSLALCPGLRPAWARRCSGTA